MQRGNPVPAHGKTPPPEVLYSWNEYVSPSWTDKKMAQPPRSRECSNCGIILRSNAPWFCAGDAIYCSQMCRKPNMPFAGRKESKKDGKPPPASQSPARSPPSQCTAQQAREAQAREASRIAAVRYEGSGVPDIHGSPSFDTEKRIEPTVVAPELGSSPDNEGAEWCRPSPRPSDDLILRDR